MQSGQFWSNSVQSKLTSGRIKKESNKRNLLPPTGLVTHPSLGLALGLPPGSLPPHLPPGYTTSGQLPVGQPTSGRLIGQSQTTATGRSQPITNPTQKKENSESGKKLGNVFK